MKVWKYWKPSAVAAMNHVKLNNEGVGVLLVGNLLYVVGHFTLVYDANNQLGVGSIPRNRAACLDVTTGLWTSWDPNLNGVGWKIKQDANDPNYAFICGSFTTIGGNTRVYMCRVSLLTGTYDSAFNAGITSNGQQVVNFCQHSGNLYLAGQQSVTSGSTRIIFTKHSDTTGAVDTGFDTVPTSSTASGYSVVVIGSLLYCSGTGVSYQSTTVRHLMAVSLTTGTLDGTFTPGVGANSTASNKCWNLTNEAGAIRSVGRYTLVANDVTTRNFASEHDATTGTVSSWNPNGTTVGGVEIRKRVTDGVSDWFLGNYTQLNAVSRVGLIKLSVSGTIDTGFNANMTGAEEFNDGCIYDNSLIGVGNFNGNTFGGVARHNIVFVHKDTGALQ